MTDQQGSQLAQSSYQPDNMQYQQNQYIDPRDQQIQQNRAQNPSQQDQYQQYQQQQQAYNHQQQGNYNDQVQNYQTQLRQQQQTTANQNQPEQYMGQQQSAQSRNNDSFTQGAAQQTGDQFDLRRRYPHDFHDRKVEWWAIDKHKKEVNDEVQSIEIQIKNIRQKHILTELDKKILQKLQVRQAELVLKQMEAEEMIRQMQIYKEVLKKNNEDKQQIQSNVSNLLDQQIKEQLDKNQEYKKQKLLWEQKLLEYNRERLESEERRKKQHKEYLLNEKEYDLKRAQQKKQEFFDQIQTNKKEYNELCKIYSDKVINSEENYKQFYKVVAENHNQRQNQYFETIFKPLLERQAQLEEIIKKNVDQYQTKRAKEELDQVLRRKNELLQVKDNNVRMIGDKVHQKELDKIEKEQKVKERLEDLQNYNQYMEYKKKEKVDNQKRYKEFLDKQSNEKFDLKQNETRMTKEEKGLNKLDLQAYKQQDMGLYSMIPGWSPQIGQLPPRQNREALQQQIMDQMKKNQSQKSMQIEPTYVANVDQFQQTGQDQGQRMFANAAQNSIIRQSLPSFVPYQKVGEPLDRVNSSLQMALPNQRNLNYENLTKHGHNPITNPIPNVIQNPYIAKEFAKAQANKSNFLSQVGNNSVNGGANMITQPVNM